MVGVTAARSLFAAHDHLEPKPGLVPAHADIGEMRPGPEPDTVVQATHCREVNKLVVAARRQPLHAVTGETKAEKKLWRQDVHGTVIISVFGSATICTGSNCPLCPALPPARVLCQAERRGCPRPSHARQDGRSLRPLGPRRDRRTRSAAGGPATSVVVLGNSVLLALGLPWMPSGSWLAAERRRLV